MTSTKMGPMTLPPPVPVTERESTSIPLATLPDNTGPATHESIPPGTWYGGPETLPEGTWH